jgi:hypothetical protein
MPQSHETLVTLTLSQDSERAAVPARDLAAQTGMNIAVLNEGQSAPLKASRDVPAMGPG